MAKECFSVDKFKSEESLGYLLSRARMKLAKALDIELATYEITHAQGKILMMLSPGADITASDLARELYIDSASMTRMIDRLEKRGLINRERSGDDRRVIYLRVTAEGRELAERLPPLYCGVLNRCFAGFEKEEIAHLRELLNKFLESENAELKQGDGDLK